MMFVVGAFVYLTMLSFNLTPRLLLQDLIFGNYCDISDRSSEYLYSTDGTYRLVQYVDDAGDERKATSFYVEETAEDIHLWYLDCYRTIDSLKVLVTMHREDVEYHWISDTKLYIDEREKNIPELFELARLPDEEEDEDGESTSTIKKPIVFETEVSENDIETAETGESAE